MKGQIVYRNGEIYIGEVHEMQRDGFGEYHYNNGTVFKGQWKAGSKIEPV